MDELTEKSYWNDVYTETILQPQTTPTQPAKPGIKRFLKYYLDEYWRDYSEYREWEAIYASFLPKQKGLKIIEIGSAPGTNLVRLQHTFGYDPYGVEYTEAGAQLNRAVFIQNGLDPKHVIHADAFSESFLARYECFFDLVISRGFIEHFTELEPVIDAHLRLLKPGGQLIVTIPKLTGVPNLLFRLFNPAVIPMHNLDIMRKKRFAALFQRAELKSLFCDYYGTFKVHVCDDEQLSGTKASIMAFLKKCQLLLNLLFRAVLRKRGAESYWFSPFLIYIGTKTR